MTEAKKREQTFHRSLASESAPPTLQRPSFRLSDIWKAPITDLPVRDEILYQYLPLSKELEVMEIGPGTGFIAFRLSRAVKNLFLIDVSATNIVALREILPAANIEMACWDMSHPGLFDMVNRRVDVVESIEVLEFVPDPRTALQNMAQVLRPGGTLFLQFPNYPPPKNHGVTYFERRADLDEILQAAGFRSWRVYSLKLNPLAQWVYNNCHEKPLNLYRRRKQKDRPVRPQDFDTVWTTRNRSSIEKYKSVLYVIWWTMITVMRLGGDCFLRTELAEDILNKNLLVIAER